MEFYIWIYERASELYVRVKIKNLRLTISTETHGNAKSIEEDTIQLCSKKKRRDRIFEFQFRERERITAEFEQRDAESLKTAQNRRRRGNAESIERGGMPIAGILRRGRSVSVPVTCGCMSEENGKISCVKYYWRPANTRESR